MEKIIEALNTLKHCTGSELAKHLGCEPQQVIVDLKFLQDMGRIDCLNGIWRLNEPEIEAPRVAWK